MLTIGSRSRTVVAVEHPIDLLAACHVRIRAALVAAHSLVAATDTDPADAVAATAQFVDRYFRVALPLHAADEDESIAPRLRGLSPRLAEALAARSAEHEAHVAPTERLLALTAVIAQRPSALPSLRSALAHAQEQLAEALERHLLEEERLIFPALAQLSAAASEEIVREMRGRRAPVRTAA